MGLLAGRDEKFADRAFEKAAEAHRADRATYVVALEGRIAPTASLEDSGPAIDAIERAGWVLQHTSTAAWNSDKHENRKLILTCVFRRADQTGSAR